MKKKSTKKVSTLPTAAEVLNIEGIYLPLETANVLYAYFHAFLAKGFTQEQSFKLTERIAGFYFRSSPLS
jgi:hypothetical protein